MLPAILWRTPDKNQGKASNSLSRFGRVTDCLNNATCCRGAKSSMAPNSAAENERPKEEKDGLDDAHGLSPPQWPNQQSYWKAVSMSKRSAT